MKKRKNPTIIINKKSKYIGKQTTFYAIFDLIGTRMAKKYFKTNIDKHLF